jgi:hypothetical protein
MRLGQISRKLNLRPIQIRDFIRDKFQVEIDIDLNTKLEDNYIEALQKKYEPTPQIDLFQETPKIATTVKVDHEDQDDRWSKKAAELIKSKKEAAAKAEAEKSAAESTSTEEISTLPVIAESTASATEEKVETIVLSENKTTDQLDPFTPRRVDPEAELIKAPNTKLEGPKVVGKIVLPPTKKELEAAAKAEADALAQELAAAAVAASETDSSIEVNVEGDEDNADDTNSDELLTSDKTVAHKTAKRDPISKKIAAMQASEMDEEWSPFKDKKGIYHFSREQKDNRRKSLERIKVDKTDEVKKRAKSSYYQQNFKPEPKEIVAKKKEKKEAVSKKVKEPKPERKGIWGKFRNWLDG